jgi:hypothetical protein
VGWLLPRSSEGSQDGIGKGHGFRLEEAAPGAIRRDGRMLLLSSMPDVLLPASTLLPPQQDWRWQSRPGWGA